MRASRNLWRGFKPLDADSKVRTTWVDRRARDGDSQVELKRVILSEAKNLARNKRPFALLRVTLG
jgi:hypothetical protein